MKYFLYAGVVAPAPPEWLLTQARQDRTHNFTKEQGYDIGYTARTLYTNLGAVTNAFNHTFVLNVECLNWAKENITTFAQDIRYTETSKGQHSGPHIDQTRNYTLIYLLDPGGDCHETVFYFERDQHALIRDPGYHVDRYDSLNKIGSYKLPINQWTLLNARILHGVENIPNGRKSIQIKLIDFPTDCNLVNPQYYDF